MKSGVGVKMRDKSVGDVSLEILVALLTGQGANEGTLATTAAECVAAAEVLIAADTPKK